MGTSAETLAALTSIAEGLKTLTTETKTSNQAVKTSMESMGSTINSAMGPGGTLYNTAIRVRE